MCVSGEICVARKLSAVHVVQMDDSDLEWAACNTDACFQKDGIIQAELGWNYMCVVSQKHALGLEYSTVSLAARLQQKPTPLHDFI